MIKRVLLNPPEPPALNIDQRCCLVNNQEIKTVYIEDTINDYLKKYNIADEQVVSIVCTSANYQTFWHMFYREEDK